MKCEKCDGTGRIMSGDLHQDALGAAWTETCIYCRGHGQVNDPSDISSKIGAIFTCLKCEENYQVEAPVPECPVCGWSRTCNHWPGQKRCGVCGMGMTAHTPADGCGK